MTVYAEMTHWRERQCFKHALGPDASKYAEEQIAGLGRVEFLRELSEAIDLRVKELIEEAVTEERRRARGEYE